MDFQVAQKFPWGPELTYPRVGKKQLGLWIQSKPVGHTLEETSQIEKKNTIGLGDYSWAHHLD